jgi:chemotaxis protein methyltransferase CheR
MEDAHFHKLLDRFGLSRSGYRRVRKGVKKRISRHMQEIGCHNLEDYIRALEHDRRLRLQFECVMAVSISRFFRDRELWEILQRELLPLLASRADRTLRVWSAGCASGEEPYSLKMLWEEIKGSFARPPTLSILGTDLCSEHLERAKAAVYARGSVREVPEPIRASCFEKIGRGKYAVKPSVRQGIEWRVHDLLRDPPGTAFDLIFLRNNLLTYYKDEIKGPALTKVVDSLAPEGFLIIGRRESMPPLPDLATWEKNAPILQKNAP